MNLFTENQVNQVYVANGIKGGGNLTDEDKGKIKLRLRIADGEHPNIYTKLYTKAISIEHFGPGGITRSDNIDVDKIMYVTCTPAAEMQVALKEYTITVDSSALENGNVIPNQDYILRIELTNYIGVSPEDSHYWKYGMVHTTANMTPADFYKALAKSILNNMSREAVSFLDIYNGSTKVDLSNVDSQTFSNLVIREVEPDWILGLKKQKIVHFNITGIPFDYDGETIYWLNGEDEEHEVAPTDSSVVLNNSKLAADYEYFFHGERGDQYRMVGWPDYIPTKYMVDPNNQYGYDFVQIHYYYIGPNEGSQRSEKDVTILCKRTENDDPETLGETAGTIEFSIEDWISHET